MSDRADADRDFEQRFARIEGLLAQLSVSRDPLVERVTREVLATVLELHQRGLARLLELSAADEQARAALVRDPRVSAMLLLHGLHPLSLDTRIARTLDGLRERFQSKLADVTLEAHGARFAVRLVPTAGACASTRAALKQDFEQALLSAAPDAESVSVELAEPAPALITLRRRRDANDGHPEGSPR